MKGNDEFYLALDGQYTDRDHTPGQGAMGQGGGADPALLVPQISDASYLASGEITDIVVIARTELPDTPWPTRHAGTAFVYDGHLWMVAGSHPGSTPIHDVWRLETIHAP